MAKARNFEVISDEINVSGICTSVKTAIIIVTYFWLGAGIAQSI
jgi:hypothetical protein